MQLLRDNLTVTLIAVIRFILASCHSAVTDLPNSTILLAKWEVKTR